MSTCKGKTKTNCDLDGNCVWVNSVKGYCRKKAGKALAVIIPAASSAAGPSAAPSSPSGTPFYSPINSPQFKSPYASPAAPVNTITPIINSIKANLEAYQSGSSTRAEVATLLDNFKQFVSLNNNSDILTTQLLLTDIYESEFIKSLYANYVNSLTATNQKNKIKKYNYVYNSKFADGLNDAIDTDAKLKHVQTELIRIFTNPNILEIPDNLYDTLLIIVNSSMNSSNYSYSYKLQSNVLSTRDIYSLTSAGIYDFSKIENNFTNFKRFDKTSASDSIILTANLKNTVSSNSLKKRSSLNPSKIYYFKIFPNGADYTEVNTKLLVELDIYNQLYKLVENNITPNVLVKVLSGKLMGFKHFFNGPSISDAPNPPSKNNPSGDSDRDLLQETIDDINDGLGLGVGPADVWDDVGVILTNPGGPPLHDVLQTLTNEQRKSVFFQLFYTLHIFDKLQISQGDLHTGNIFVIDIEPTELCYLVKDKNGGYHKFKFTTDKLVKIYDFDHGMIGKKTDIKRGITIDKILNPERAETEFFNTQYAETSIYNNKVDMMIMLCWGLVSGRSDGTKLSLGITPDTEFNGFIRSIYGGLSSTETIKQTYDRILSNPANNEQLKEFNRLMAKPITDAYNTDIFKTYVVGVLKYTWQQYYLQIACKHFGRIIKTGVGQAVKNNHLWIPDEIVLPNEDVLLLPYFDSLKFAGNFDSKVDNVFTIADRII